MQMPSTAQLSSADVSTSQMERNNDSDSDSASLHSNLANFVLDLQTDVRLEDLLDNDENKRVNGVQATQNIPAERKEVHIKHLRHLYHAIKSQQKAVINAHEQPSKRGQAENSTGFSRTKTMRNSEFLLRDTDCLDETWLMNFASQLGLDKKVDLPELNSDLMQEFL